MKRSASAGATLCHIAWVCGLPCSSSSGGPEPPWRSRMPPPGTRTSIRVKPSKNIVSLRVTDAVEGLDVEPFGRFAPARVVERGPHRRHGAAAVLVLRQRDDHHARQIRGAPADEFGCLRRPITRSGRVAGGWMPKAPTMPTPSLPRGSGPASFRRRHGFVPEQHGSLPGGGPRRLHGFRPEHQPRQRRCLHEQGHKAGRPGNPAETGRYGPCPLQCARQQQRHEWQAEAR